MSTEHVSKPLIPGPFTIIFLIFITLKLSGLVDWSWWFVFLPLMLPWALVVVAILLTWLVLFIANLISQSKK